MLASWYALFEARIRRWNGVTLRDRWANLGGQRVTPVDAEAALLGLERRDAPALSVHVSHRAGRAAPYLDAMRRYRIR